jgi:hypothetical protein
MVLVDNIWDNFGSHDDLIVDYVIVISLERNIVILNLVNKITLVLPFKRCCRLVLTRIYV